MSRVKDLTGRKFGKLTVIKKSGRKNGKVTWLCKCDCGSEKVVVGAYLRDGNTKSCGCLTMKHGHNTKRKGRTSEHIAWGHMMQRCYNEKNRMYRFYGGKGVKVCDRWHDFNNFLEDMGEKPTPEHSLDRIDVYGDYEPSNCKWSTREEQDRNKRLREINKTGVNGVSFDKRTKKYRATIGVNGKSYYSKRFDTLEEAAQARKELELKYWEKSSL